MSVERAVRRETFTCSSLLTSSPCPPSATSSAMRVRTALPPCLTGRRAMKDTPLRLLFPAAALFIAAPASAAGWFACGDLSQIGWSCQLASYPTTQYEYGIAYNMSEPSTVTCSYWNYGMRIYN